MRAGLDPGSAGPLEETITLQQAKKLVQCMAHEHSFLLLAPPGVGKSEMVYQAAQEAGLACRSLLGTQIAPEDVSGVPRIVGERSVFCPPARRMCKRRSTPYCRSGGSASTRSRAAPGWWPRATASRTGRWCARSARRW